MDAFDAVAASYDVDFTRTAIGSAQREQVWRALAPLLHQKTMNVLELNCGTGADAVHIAQAGHRVLATDRSQAMLRITHRNIERLGLHDRVTTASLDLNNPLLPPHEAPFDLVLSNLGGLNCVDTDALARLAERISLRMNTGGRFIAVLLADRCMIETLYFLLRGRPTAAFRRWRKGPLSVPVGNSTVPTWYHSPAALCEAFLPYFVRERSQPIGLCVPPSYLEPRFRSRPRSLRNLQRIDLCVGRSSLFTRLGDHYLIQFRRAS
jgi:SAM-dependent methyltransferase